VKQRLIVFARAPRLGRGKRRLAAGIGAVAAWRFQCWALARVLRRLARDRRWQCWLAVTGGPARWPRGVRRLNQGRSDLGRRMGQAMRSLGPGPVVLVGADIPDIAPRHIAAAFRALARHDAVFGPAGDGGFWLVGLRGGDPFRGVRWSSRHALADTLANLGRRRTHALLETLVDIDDAAAHADYFSSRRGINSTKLQGAKRLSS
jgi:rSAM/selenodomain-associated transferase 1